MRHFAPLPLLVALAACGDDGSAPEINTLSFMPSTVPVGQQTTVSGAFLFEDPDGDLDALGVDVVLPGGQRQSLPRSDIPGAGGVKSGPVTWAMLLTPPSAGTYTFEIYVIDEADHESNRLTGTITAP